MNILWKYRHENRHGSIYEQYMWHKWVWRFGSKKKAQKKKEKKKATGHACDCRFQPSHCIITSQHWPTVKPILSKEQRVVALRQQGRLQSHFYICMQANNPRIGLEKYYLVTVTTYITKLSHMMDRLYTVDWWKNIVRGSFSLISICSFQILQCYYFSIWRHFKPLNTGPTEVSSNVCMTGLRDFFNLCNLCAFFNEKLLSAIQLISCSCYWSLLCSLMTEVAIKQPCSLTRRGKAE